MPKRRFQRVVWCESVNTSAAAWWCHWLCQRWAKPVSCLWSQAPKWTATTTALVCSDKVCCRISLPSVVATGGLWRTVAHGSQHHRVPVASEYHLHRTGHVATQQPGLKPGRLCHFGALQEHVYHGRTFENVEHWSRRSCWSGAHCHRGSLMAVSTSGGVACRVSYRRMVDILNTSSTSCRHLYSSIVVCCRRYKRWTICRSATYDFFSKLYVCDSRVDRMWRHLAC